LTAGRVIQPLPFPYAQINQLMLRWASRSPFVQDAKQKHSAWERRFDELRRRRLSHVPCADNTETAHKGYSVSKIAEQVILPLPELLPSSREELMGAGKLIVKHRLDASVIAVAQTSPARAREGVVALRENSVVQDALVRYGPKWDAQAQAQDDFFGIKRVPGNSAGILVSGLLLACVEAIENLASAASSVPDQDREDLFRGATSLLNYCLNGTVDASTETPSLLPMEGSAVECDPKIRWEVGHRLFFSLTQGITTALSCFATAVVHGHVSDSVQAMRLATVLMKSSRGALLFTADFPQSAYTGDVRLSMMPPYVAPGFSGVQGRDHQVLVEVLRGLRPVFADIDRDKYPYEEFKAATMRLHSAHEYVCVKFVGETKPSLRMEARNKSGSNVTGAAAVVRQINERRLRLIDPSLPKR
jgi:hypothetical protein